jgi:hypothetical protein
MWECGSLCAVAFGPSRFGLATLLSLCAFPVIRRLCAGYAPVIRGLCNRDPRWGRNVEVPGEDPLLNGLYGEGTIERNECMTRGGARRPRPCVTRCSSPYVCVTVCACVALAGYTQGLQLSNLDGRYLQAVSTLKCWGSFEYMACAPFCSRAHPPPPSPLSVLRRVPLVVRRRRVLVGGLRQLHSAHLQRDHQQLRPCRLVLSSLQAQRGQRRRQRRHVRVRSYAARRAVYVCEPVTWTHCPKLHERPFRPCAPSPVCAQIQLYQRCAVLHQRLLAARASRRVGFPGLPDQRHVRSVAIQSLERECALVRVRLACLCVGWWWWWWWRGWGDW